MKSIVELIDYIKQHDGETLDKESFSKYFWIYEGMKRKTNPPEAGVGAAMMWQEGIKIELYKELKKNEVDVIGIDDYWITKC